MADREFTIGQAARLAIDVQDACNLSGVVRSFAEVTDTIWRNVRASGGGTREVNTHPIAVLFTSKIGDLSGVGCGDFDAFSKAYDTCKQLADAEGR